MESERCTINEIQIGDYEEVKKLYFDRKVRKFLGGPVSIASYECSFREMLNTDDSLYWTIRLKSTNIFVGLISLDTHHDGISKELSYQFLPVYWGKGYASETIKIVIDFAFKNLKLHKVISETQVANKASCNLLVRLGMSIEEKIIRFNAEQYIFSLYNGHIYGA